MNLQEFHSAVASLPFEKTLPTARYLYAPDESALPEPVASFVAKIRQRLALDASFNILKLSPPDQAISFLRYPEFLTEAHPAIAESVRIHLARGTVKPTDFTSHSNQPILHRKECFLPPGHAKHRLFEALTRAEEAAGLFAEPTRFGEATFEAARAQKRDDLLAYLALANFRKKVPLEYLSDRLQGDIRSFFGTCESARQSSREILFAAGDSRHIETACEAFAQGCQHDDALQIHRSLLPELPAILRIYVLCAARVYGGPDEADIIKIHKHSGKVTFQYYDGFFDNPFPLMLWRIKVNLRRQSADVFDHRQPPYQQLLCFKERFLGPDHPERLACGRLAHRLRRLNVTPESAGYGLAPEILMELRSRHSLTGPLMPKKKLPPA